jgi:hypothetical protein
MGNLQNPQYQGKEDRRANIRVNRSSDSCLMGPSRLLFSKFRPKNLDLSEDLAATEDDPTLSEGGKG